MAAPAVPRQDSVDAQLIQAPESGAEQRARDFDRIVGILTDEVMSRFPEGRATLEHVVRSRCCSLVDDHTKMLMASFQQREETGRIRQEAKSRSVRRMHEIQIRQQGETVALLKALKLRSTETLIAKGDVQRSWDLLHITLSLWHQTARFDRLQKQCRAAEAAAMAAGSAVQLANAAAATTLDKLSATPQVQDQSKTMLKARKPLNGQENAPPSNVHATVTPARTARIPSIAERSERPSLLEAKPLPLTQQVGSQSTPPTGGGRRVGEKPSSSVERTAVRTPRLAEVTQSGGTPRLNDLGRRGGVNFKVKAKGLARTSREGSPTVNRVPSGPLPAVEVSVEVVPAPREEVVEFNCASASSSYGGELVDPTRVESPPMLDQRAARGSHHEHRGTSHGALPSSTEQSLGSSATESFAENSGSHARDSGSLSQGPRRQMSWSNDLSRPILNRITPARSAQTGARASAGGEGGPRTQSWVPSVRTDSPLSTRPAAQGTRQVGRGAPSRTHSAGSHGAGVSSSLSGPRSLGMVSAGRCMPMSSTSVSSMSGRGRAG